MINLPMPEADLINAYRQMGEISPEIMVQLFAAGFGSLDPDQIEEYIQDGTPASILVTQGLADLRKQAPNLLRMILSERIDMIIAVVEPLIILNNIAQASPAVYQRLTELDGGWEWIKKGAVNVRERFISLRNGQRSHSSD